MESLQRRALLNSDPPLPPNGQGLCYRDARHFDEFTGRAARRTARKRGSVWAKVAWHSVGAAMLYIAGITVIATCFAVLGVVIGLRLSWAVLLVVIFVYQPVVRRVRKESLMNRVQAFIDDWSCFVCDYSLVGNEHDAAGWSACPECGRTFHINEYERPEKHQEREWDHEWINHLESSARDEMRDRLGLTKPR